MLKTKIFIIGFNKTGTRTLHYYFRNNGLNSIHWKHGNIVSTFEKNIENCIPLLSSYENIHVFSDITNGLDKDAKNYYKQLDKENPNSKFILNIRNINDWIISRKNHPGFLSKQCLHFNCNHNEIVEIWKNIYISHINEVIKYFENRDNDLLIFNIDTDNFIQINNFLKDIYSLDSNKWNIVGKTINKLYTS
jgi:hypothetical protein